jgi:hypothetical protein
MAKNDKILIDGIIDERVDIKLPSDKRDEAFEYFAFEQILKDYDLTTDELQAGSVDGRNDGGIDGFFIFINGHYLSDPISFQWPKTGSILDVWVITCKHQDTFKQAPLDNLAASMTELLDFTIENERLSGEYSEQVLKQRENLKFAYRKVSPRLTKFSLIFCYACRGNTSELGSSIISRAKQISQTAIDSFGNCSSDFIFYGSSELIELHRKAPNFSLELPFIENLSSGERYIVLVNLKDYYNFITDEGKLRRYLFDSNVRDFMGLNRVNEDIRETLNNPNSPDFWWLNNGITILATGAVVIGKCIQIQDIQIVNGLQTSESIFRHFVIGGKDPMNRSVLVKVIVSKDDSIRDSIIRATNNQTTVELASLHATDKTQRDIEDVLKQNDFYYERRANFYKNQGLSSDRLITPLYIASGFVNLILKSADQASRLKSRFMRSEESYTRVFSPDTDLKVWPQIAFVLKKTDNFLESVRPTGNMGSERFLKSKRQFLSFLTISRLLESFNFTIGDLISFDIQQFNLKELKKTWIVMNSIESEDNYRYKVQKSYFVKLCKVAHKKWKIGGIERILKEHEHALKEKSRKKELRRSTKPKVTKTFALRVNDLLPKQPWKPGMHHDIIKKLNCTTSEYFDAVKLLIADGYCNVQKDGVVYDDDGNIIAFDEERVNAETLKLKTE